MPTENDFRHLWTLDPEITYLNHGSFGACPDAVLKVQADLQRRMEREPMRFFMRDLEALADQSRRELAEFVGADADDLAFVNNASAGVATVVRSIDFKPGDEILTTDHTYPACRNTLDYVAGRAGARVVVAQVPFPLDSSDRVVEAVLSKASRKTRLALVDHITSPTGLVFPIQKVVAELSALGVDCLVDGAHAPGMVPVDLKGLGAAYYTANCHKWMCTPKGSALLHVRKDKQAGIHPLVVSHGATAKRTDRSRFRLEFDWTGTDDPSPFLCIGESIRQLGALLPGGWAALRARNRFLALAARELLCQALKIKEPAPAEMIGSLSAVPLPDLKSAPAGQFDPLQDLLLRDQKIEVMVFGWPEPPKRLLRISAQMYNSAADYQKLANAVKEAFSG